MIASAPVRHFASIDSTNLEARRLFAGGERGPLWLVADEQLAGLGRLGRPWHSPKGNLYSSLVLPIDCPLQNVAQIGFVMALAVSDVAVRATERARVALKWPNDCLLDGGKLAGILCETLSTRPTVLCLGCGINLASKPEGLKYPAARLAGWEVGPVFDLYRTSLDHRLAQWLDQGFSSIAADWATLAVGMNETVSIHTGHQHYHGVMQGLAEDGALILNINNQLQRFCAGDLTIPSLQAMRRKSS